MPREPRGENAELIKEAWGATHCGLCGEPFHSLNEEVGEFATEEVDDELTERLRAMTPIHKHVIAHAQCGLDAKYELA